MAPKNAKSKRPEAERAAEHYCREALGCVITRRALRTKFAAVDFFASDVVGKRADGTHVYVQATAGQNAAVTARRRKLEKIPWHPSDTVQLVQLVQTDDPANGRRKKWFFRVHEYGVFTDSCEAVFDETQWRDWTTHDEAVTVPREWFKAWEDVDSTHKI